MNYQILPEQRANAQGALENIVKRSLPVFSKENSTIEAIPKIPKTFHGNYTQKLCTLCIKKYMEKRLDFSPLSCYTILVNKKDLNKNKKEITKMKKMVTIFCAAIILWASISWVDVIADNSHENPNHASWNLIIILEEVI